MKAAIVNIEEIQTSAFATMMAVVAWIDSQLRSANEPIKMKIRAVLRGTRQKLTLITRNADLER